MKPRMFFSLRVLIAVLLWPNYGWGDSYPNVALTEFHIKCPDIYPDWKESGDMVVILSISGGGKRASAYAYGVLSELQKIPFGPAGGPTLLHEIDFISGVSGGSVIAAFLKLSRDLHAEPADLLNGFEKFLYHGTEGAIWRGLLNPVNWWRFATSSHSRTDLLADYFDDWLYSRSTFGKLKPWPYLVITATDLFTGQRFNFNETQFNCIGSEYEKFRLAHAVAASSAYPLFFPTLTLKNFNYPQPERIQPDRKRGPYIPLSDGGLVDNYATRVYLELLGRGRLIGDPTGRPRPPAKAFVFIRIDASRVDLDASPDSPSLLARVQRAFDVASEQQIKDSDYLFTSEIERVWDRWKTNCDAKPPFQYKYINARLRNGSPDLQKIPTRWTLDDDEIKLLIKEGSDAIKAQKESIQEFLELLPRSGKEDLICHHSTPEVAAIETPDH